MFLPVFTALCIYCTESEKNRQINNKIASPLGKKRKPASRFSFGPCGKPQMRMTPKGEVPHPSSHFRESLDETNTQIHKQAAAIIVPS